MNRAVPTGVTLLLVVALFVLAPALAQVPGAPTVGVTVNIQDDAGKASVEKPARFQVEIRNTQAATGVAQIDEQNMADVKVTVSGAPEGWSASISEPSFKLGPAKSKTVQLVVALSTDTTTDAATLTVRADLASPLAALNPILGNLPGGSQNATAEDTIEITRDEPFTREVLETIGPFIYLLLLGLVALVIALMLVSRAKGKAGVRIWAVSNEQNVKPGGRASFTVRVGNGGKQPDTLVVQVSELPTGWSTSLGLTELELDADAEKELRIQIVAPIDAEDGLRQSVLVTATSARSPKRSAAVELVAVVTRRSKAQARLA